MVHDYSGRYSSVIRKQYPAGGKKKPHRSNRPSPVWGTVLLLTLLVGVGASFWVNYRIEADLTALADEIAVRQQRIFEGEQLQVRKKTLLDPGMVEKKASGYGLFPPTAKQRRSP